MLTIFGALVGFLGNNLLPLQLGCGSAELPKVGTTALYHYEKRIAWAQADTSGLVCIFGAIFGMFFA